MRIDFEAGVYGGGGGDGTWGEDGGWRGDGGVDLQAMGKSLEWDLRGLASTVGGELVGMGFFFIFFFFSRFNYFKILMILLIINVEILIWCFSC